MKQLELKGKTVNLPIGLLFLVGSAVWAGLNSNKSVP